MTVPPRCQLVTSRMAVCETRLVPKIASTILGGSFVVQQLQYQVCLRTPGHTVCVRGAGAAARAGGAAAGAPQPRAHRDRRGPAQQLPHARARRPTAGRHAGGQRAQRAAGRAGRHGRDRHRP